MPNTVKMHIEYTQLSPQEAATEFYDDIPTCGVSLTEWGSEIKPENGPLFWGIVQDPEQIMGEYPERFVYTAADVAEMGEWFEFEGGPGFEGA